MFSGDEILGDDAVGYDPDGKLAKFEDDHRPASFKNGECVDCGDPLTKAESLKGEICSECWEFGDEED